MSGLLDAISWSVMQALVGFLVWKAVDTDNPVTYGLAVAFGLTTIGIMIHDATTNLSRALIQNANSNRRG